MKGCICHFVKWQIHAFTVFHIQGDVIADTRWHCSDCTRPQARSLRSRSIRAHLQKIILYSSYRYIYISRYQVDLEVWIQCIICVAFATHGFTDLYLNICYDRIDKIIRMVYNRLDIFAYFCAISQRHNHAIHKRIVSHGRSLTQNFLDQTFLAPLH